MNKRLCGFYVITDENLIPRDSFIETVEKSIKGGADIIQLREKTSSTDDIIALGKALHRITKKYNVPLIINDYPEVAREIGAEGVHLGENDYSISSARQILGNNSIIGISCYNQLQRGINGVREGADYLTFGTPFYTTTKPDREPTKLKLLIEAKRLLKDLPIFAIGGINKENACSVLKTGIDGIAVITSVFGSTDPEKSSAELSSIVKKH